ncbi:hypothetical protein OIO90_006110 [Microbotryomycetes sp. JL221]|nr:hypothetical protein OIO90_006110 [Microbotryomycetes sp. JL221]
MLADSAPKFDVRIDGLTTDEALDLMISELKLARKRRDQFANQRTAAESAANTAILHIKQIGRDTDHARQIAQEAERKLDKVNLRTARAEEKLKDVQEHIKALQQAEKACQDSLKASQERQATLVTQWKQAQARIEEMESKSTKEIPELTDREQELRFEAQEAEKLEQTAQVDGERLDRVCRCLRVLQTRWHKLEPRVRDHLRKELLIARRIELERWPEDVTGCKPTLTPWTDASTSDAIMAKVCATLNLTEDAKSL